MSQSAVVQVPPTAEENGIRNKNTGFPEPLSMDRNTTLTHPEADTSINATLEGQDVPTSRSNSRHTVRLPSFRHSHKTSSGRVVDEDKILQEMYKDIEYADGTKEPVNIGAVNGAEPALKGRDSGVEGLGLDVEDRKNDGYSSGEKKKKGFLKKLGIN